MPYAMLSLGLSFLRPKQQASLRWRKNAGAQESIKYLGNSSLRLIESRSSSDALRGALGQLPIMPGTESAGAVSDVCEDKTAWKEAEPERKSERGEFSFAIKKRKQLAFRLSVSFKRSRNGYSRSFPVQRRGCVHSLDIRGYMFQHFLLTRITEMNPSAQRRAHRPVIRPCFPLLDRVTRGNLSNASICTRAGAKSMPLRHREPVQLHIQ